MATVDDLASDLTGAVERGEIQSYYQVQVDVSSLRVVGVEALARWAHPRFGLVPPNIFIPLAEAFTVIHEIGGFMVNVAVRQLALWRELGIDLELAVNVSPLQLSDLAFLDGVQASADTHRVPIDRLVLEVTESQPVVLVEAVVAQLSVMREQGLGISIDDVGAGYSAFAQMAGVPATEIKIDRSLVQDPGSAPGILQGIISDAHAAGQRVVAEGVETEDHLSTARSLNCDRGQGYFFGRPMAADQLTPLLLPA